MKIFELKFVDVPNCDLHTCLKSDNLLYGSFFNVLLPKEPGIIIIIRLLSVLVVNEGKKSKKPKIFGVFLVVGMMMVVRGHKYKNRSVVYPTLLKKVFFVPKFVCKFGDKKYPNFKKQREFTKKFEK